MHPRPRTCLLGTIAALSAIVPVRAQPAFGPGESLGNLNSAALNEVSGLAASRVNPGVLWCHNDSGDSARVFAIDPQARLLGTYSMPGVLALDFEDIAVGPGPVPGISYLYIGDIGDNLAFRASVRVHRAPEPIVGLAQAAAPALGTLAGAAAISLTYPDGPRDAEALLIDPVSGDLFIVTKAADTARMYTASAAQLATSTSIPLAFAGTVPLGGAGRRVTAGDFSSDGRFIVLRGLGFALLLMRDASEPAASAFGGPSSECGVIGPPLEPQGEAIAFGASVHGYYTLSEGVGAALYHFPRGCLADFNGAGGVTVQDAYDFLSDWQAGRPAADFNGSTPELAGVSVQDLYDYLSAWLAGCP